VQYGSPHVSGLRTLQVLNKNVFDAGDKGVQEIHALRLASVRWTMHTSF